MSLPFRDRFLYGIGGCVYAVKESAYMIFVLLFYTQVLGLSGALAGTMLFFSLLWDAISDPIVGTWSDRFQSRWGRRHPFMVAGAIPLGIGFVFLFAPPAAVVQDSSRLALWLLFWSLWLRTAVTFYSLPHLALAVEMTSDYHERSRLLGGRIGFMFFTTVCLPAVGLTLIFSEYNGQDGRFVIENYLTYGWLCAVVVWITAVLSILGTAKFIATTRIEEHRLPSGDGVWGLVRNFLATLGNRNFRNLLFYDLAASASYGIAVTLNVMAWTYYWGLGANGISLIMALPALTAVPLAVYSMSYLGRRFPKHRILSMAVVFMLLDMVWIYPLRIFGIIPENGHWLIVALLFLQNFLFIYFFVLRVTAAFSITADVSDEHEADHGTRQEGGFYAAMAFSSKMASAAGPLFAGIALDFVGLNEQVNPGLVPQSVLDALVWAMLIGTVPLMLVAWYYATRVSMSEQQLQEIHRRISARAVEQGA